MAEYGYRLVTLRGNRRLYRLGAEQSSLQTFLEIHQKGSRILFKGWMTAAWSARALRLFALPPEMPLDPKGWAGIRYRRRVCHGLNDLLERFQQPPLLGSTTFHWGDLEASSLTLVASFVGAIVLFFSLGWSRLGLSRLTYSPEVLEGLAWEVSLPVGTLFGLSLAVVLVYRRWVLPHCPWGWARAMVVFGLGALMWGGSLGLAKELAPPDPARAAVMTCLGEPTRCDSAFASLTPQDRRRAGAQLRAAGEELVRASRKKR